MELWIQSAILVILAFILGLSFKAIFNSLKKIFGSRSEKEWTMFFSGFILGLLFGAGILILAFMRW